MVNLPVMPPNFLFMRVDQHAQARSRRHSSIHTKEVPYSERIHGHSARVGMTNVQDQQCSIGSMTVTVKGAVEVKLEGVVVLS